MYGMKLPVMNLHERVLSVLGCRYVDDVLIDAPYTITRDIVATMRIDEIIRVQEPCDHTSLLDSNSEEARVQVAIDLDILKDIQVETDFRIGNLFHRIHSNQSSIQAKFERKIKVEEEYMVSFGKEQNADASALSNCFATSIQ
jgi:ethanolamine-phosphate cytidylyltransferase